MKGIASLCASAAGCAYSALVQWRRCTAGAGLVSLCVLVWVGLGAAGVRAAGAAPGSVSRLTVFTDEIAGPPLMGLGVQLDPYDTQTPNQINWPLLTQRLEFMRPGFLRVVEPASSYFGGYDAAGNPTYRWTDRGVQELLSILSIARNLGITVVLGDWRNPLIGGDARIPIEFIGQLRNTYGYTNVRYYNLTNEPNGSSSCDFACWRGMMKAVAGEIGRQRYQNWLSLVGPDNANSWDDTRTARSLDRTVGLDLDNPLGGDAWVTGTLTSIPTLVGAYDSHRYATIWGVENGVYGDQVRARREQISNLDSPAKPYFAGEVGLTARQTTPFTARDAGNALMARSLLPLLDPSSRRRASTFVDSQPHIAEFNYGVWMGDMMIQALGAGLSGASAWDLDDAMHTGGQYGADNLKRWGFWNSLGGQDGYPTSDLTPRPWYYAWSVLSRAFPAGSQSLVVPSTGVSGLRATAARIPDGPGFDLSLAVVNDSDTPRSVILTVPTVPGALTLARYDFFSGQQAVDANGFAVPDQTVVGHLGAGVTVSLPSRGLVVLTSHGFAAPVILDEGTRTLLDNLNGWTQTYAHTSGLTLDHSNVAQFNYASSRATLRPPPKPKPKGKTKGKSKRPPKPPRPQFLAFRRSQVTSFELKAYSASAPQVSVYGSEDGSVWAPIALASTNPAPAVGGRELLSGLLPARSLPAGINRVKLVLGRGTELAQVAIEDSRSGPACLAPIAAARANTLTGFLPGAIRPAVLGSIGPPGSSSRLVWRYCVAGGAELAVVFPRHGGASLIATTARGYRLDGIGPGASVSSLRRRYGRTDLRAVGTRLLVTPAGQVFIIRSGRVTAVALVGRTVLAKPGALQVAVRLAGLG